MLSSLGFGTDLYHCSMSPIDHASLYIDLDHSYELYAFLVDVVRESKVELFNHLVTEQELAFLF